MKPFIISIPQKIRKELFGYTSKTSNEVCGVLIGKKVKRRKYLITSVIYDNSPISPSPYRVTRNTKNIFPDVNADVINSKHNEVDYIGDWHSHPNSFSKYSIIDKMTMISMLSDPDYYFLEDIVLMIVKPPNTIRAFLFFRNKNNPIEMMII